MELIQVVSCTIQYFDQITQIFVIGSYLKILKQIFQSKKIPRVCLHDYLKRLSSKVCFDASITSLSRFIHFVSVLTINAAEHNVVAYSHAYVYG